MVDFSEYCTVLAKPGRTLPNCIDATRKARIKLWRSGLPGAQMIQFPHITLWNENNRAALFHSFPPLLFSSKKAYPPERRKQLAKQHTHDEKWQGPMGGRDRERSRSGSSSSQQKFILGLKQIACLPKSPRSWRQVRKEAVKKEEEGKKKKSTLKKRAMAAWACGYLLCNLTHNLKSIELASRYYHSPYIKWG